VLGQKLLDHGVVTATEATLGERNMDSASEEIKRFDELERYRSMIDMADKSVGDLVMPGDESNRAASSGKAYANE
jgi:hypothetical protein